MSKEVMKLALDNLIAECRDQYAVPVLFNPYTGEPRDVRDVQSDPQGILIVPPGKVEMRAAKPEHHIEKPLELVAEALTCKQQVWVQSTGQFSWEPQDERFWTRLTNPPAQIKPLTDEETKVLWHKARLCMGSNRWTVFKKLIEAAHGIKENT